jgi:hypothetical protein
MVLSGTVVVLAMALSQEENKKDPAMKFLYVPGKADWGRRLGRARVLEAYGDLR